MRKISIAEPVTELRHIKIVDNGEPLVDFLKACPELVLDHPRFTYRRETVVRESVARMLCEANATLLKQGYRLAIVEGWRPPHIQKRMYLGAWARWKKMHPEWSDVTLRRVVNRFTAPPHGRVPPPHSTGGAVDLVLADKAGNVQDAVSPHEPYEPACFPFAAATLSYTARANRQRLWDAIVPTGMTNYPSEYWHWTYGDQGWAYRGGHPNALYGPITPNEYQPQAADVSDEPLVLLPIDLERNVLTASGS
jgi:D-alanyl-D-alanine dipeptidase